MIEDTQKKTNNEIIPKNQIKESIKKKIFLCKKIYMSTIPKEKGDKVYFLCKKTLLFKADDKKNFTEKIKGNYIINTGRWTIKEKELFLEGIVSFGINWKNFKKLIKTRTSKQVRSHAQKFFIKMKLCKDETLGIDFTLNSICNIKDMINQIKSINENYDIKCVFRYLNENNKSKKFNHNFINNLDSNLRIEEKIEQRNFYENIKNNNDININYNINNLNFHMNSLENHVIQNNLNSQINNFSINNNLLLNNNNYIYKNIFKNFQDILINEQIKAYLNNQILNYYINTNINNQIINNLLINENNNFFISSIKDQYINQLRENNIINYNISNYDKDISISN